MSQLEKEVTKYMITTDSTSVEAIEATKNLVTSKKKKPIINQPIYSFIHSLVVNSDSIQENLLRLIQSLGEYLTNDDEFVRAKGNWSLVIEGLDLNLLFSNWTFIQHFKE